jgi:hypothetical protein
MQVCGDCIAEGLGHCIAMESFGKVLGDVGHSANEFHFAEDRCEQQLLFILKYILISGWRFFIILFVWIDPRSGTSSRSTSGFGRGPT